MLISWTFVVYTATHPTGKPYSCSCPVCNLPYTALCPKAMQMLSQLVSSSVNAYCLPYITRLLAASASCSYATARQSNIALSQDALVDYLQQQGLLTERAAKAMRAVDRSHYVQTYTGVPETVAYQDTPVPIGCGQHMDSPSTVARFLSLLEPYVQPGASVLDLGAGTGYMTACLANLAAPKGVVLALEKQAKLIARAKANIKASNRELLEEGAFDFRVCNIMDDPKELQGAQRFHAIHLGASVEQVPQQFIELLKPGGRLVLPLGAMHGAEPQVLTTIDKAVDGSVTRTEHGATSTRIAPLTAVYDDQV